MKIAVLASDYRETRREYSRVQPEFETFNEALISGFREIPGLEIHVISCLQRPVSSPDKLAENIYYHGLTVPKIGWLRTCYQGCVRAVRRRVKEIHPDIVHGEGTERECAISAVFSGFPNVVTVHGNMRMIAKLYNAKPWSYLGLTAMLEGLILPQAHGVVCLNRYVLKNVGNLNRRTWIIPNAVDSSFFEITPARLEPPTVLCVGLICLHKNQIAFLEALASLRKELDFRILFLGGTQPGDPYAETFSRIAREHPWVEVAGFAGRDRVKKEMAKATLLVLPSLEDNCPMILLEAAAAGLPTIGSNVGGVPELIDHGFSGMLCNPHQQESIRNTVRQMLTNPKRAQAMAAAAKQRALERFHPSVVAKQHIAFYKQILGSPSYRMRIPAMANCSK